MHGGSYINYYKRKRKDGGSYINYYKRKRKDGGASMACEVDNNISSLE
jgi:hypothetical protein